MEKGLEPSGKTPKDAGRVTERPILFSAPMVCALLDGVKTQTRRLVKPQPVGGDAIIQNHLSLDWMVGQLRDSENAWRDLRCPYGQPGDRLWVRETWGLHGAMANAKPRDFHNPRAALSENLVFLATADGYDRGVQHWRPSIHMPRWASRINLEVTGVRVERLQDITPADAKAEGDKERSGMPEYYERSALCHVDWYRNLWNDINGAGSWNANPYVWVIEFKVIASLLEGSR